MAVANASWYSLPTQFSSICPHATIFCFIIITHKAQKGHIHRGHSKLECFKVKTKLLTKTVEYRQHPCCILHLLRIRFYISTIEGAAIVHVHLVIISQVSHKCWNVPSNWAFQNLRKGNCKAWTCIVVHAWACYNMGICRDNQAFDVCKEVPEILQPFQEPNILYSPAHVCKWGNGYALSTCRSIYMRRWNRMLRSVRDIVTRRIKVTFIWTHWIVLFRATFGICIWQDRGSEFWISWGWHGV